MKFPIHFGSTKRNELTVEEVFVLTASFWFSSHLLQNLFGRLSINNSLPLPVTSYFGVLSCFVSSAISKFMNDTYKENYTSKNYIPNIKAEINPLRKLNLYFKTSMNKNDKNVNFSSYGKFIFGSFLIFIILERKFCLTFLPSSVSHRGVFAEYFPFQSSIKATSSIATSLQRQQIQLLGIII
jgi:hypothetical protein